MSSTIVLSLYKTSPSEGQHEDSPDHNAPTTLDKPRSSIAHDANHNKTNEKSQTLTLQGQVIEDPSLYYIITQIPHEDGTSSSTSSKTSEEISQTTHSHHPDTPQTSSQDKKNRHKISTTLIKTPSPLLLSHPQTKIVAIGTHTIPRQHVQDFTRKLSTPSDISSQTFRFARA